MLFFLKLNPFIKVLPSFCLLNAMFSYVPLLSLIAFMQITVCCYFFWLCSKVKNFDPVFKMLQAVFILNGFLLLMKATGHEPIANFGENVYFGTNGQHMQSASLMVILGAVLIGYHKSNIGLPFIASLICNSAGAFLSSGIGLAIYGWRKFSKRMVVSLLIVLVVVFSIWMIAGGKFRQNIHMDNSRLLTWINTTKLSMEYPVMGWGIGTYKVLFPVYGRVNFEIPWKTAHNDYLQVLFEMGLSGILFMFAYCWNVLSRMFVLMRRSILRERAFMCLIGLAMIASNMVYHFPTKMIQAVPIIIFFLAYCDKLYEVAYGE